LNRPKVADLPTLEELFDTEEPSFDDSRIRDVLYQKTVLILGAGGQVGSALARLACAAQPRHLLLFDRNESPLYYLEVELLKKLQMVPLTPLMGDVLDEDRLRQVMATHRPEVVIHAASYTRPELLSANPLEVPRNNLQGTANLIRVAADFEVPRVLLLSLDECRHDVFGCISRATEHLMRRQDRSPGSIFAAIRFPSAIGAISCEVTRLALDLQRGAGPMVPSIDSRVGIVTMRSLAPLLFEAIAFAEDGDVLAVDAGRSQTFGEVIRYLRQVWDLPEVPIRISPVAPDHTHAVEIGTPTRHPRILRRRVAREPPPCVVTLMSQFFPEDKGGHLVENSGSR
jgi:FlaA1/EpsC-like NDP-sugar epimerase